MVEREMTPERYRDMLLRTPYHALSAFDANIKANLNIYGTKDPIFRTAMELRQSVPRDERQVPRTGSRPKPNPVVTKQVLEKLRGMPDGRLSIVSGFIRDHPSTPRRDSIDLAAAVNSFSYSDQRRILRGLANSRPHLFEKAM